MSIYSFSLPHSLSFYRLFFVFIYLFIFHMRANSAFVCHFFSSIVLFGLFVCLFCRPILARDFNLYKMVIFDSIWIERDAVSVHKLFRYICCICCHCGCTTKLIIIEHYIPKIIGTTHWANVCCVRAHWGPAADFFKVQFQTTFSTVNEKSSHTAKRAAWWSRNTQK